MKNPEIAKVFEEIDNGTITLEEANERLKAAGAPFYLNPWKNHIGRNEEGVGLMDTGTGSYDKVKVIEDEQGIRLAEPVFDAEAFKGIGAPVINVKYAEVWFKVAEDGVTLIRK